jgi:toxin FitB
MLLDSNVIIYAVRPQFQAIRRFIVQHLPAYSGISYVEALGFHAISNSDLQDLTMLLGQLPMLDVDRRVLDRAVLVRQQRRMSLGDAIIAATALVHDLTLVTRNVADFRWIAGLRLLDPIASPPTP